MTLTLFAPPCGRKNDCHAKCFWIGQLLNSHLLHLIDRLSLPLDERAARRALRDFAEDTGFDFFAYLYLRGPESFAVSNYPKEWQDLYIEREFIRVDPVVTKAKHGPAIFACVRRQGFWDNRRRELTEALVHQVCHIRPLHLDEASGAV